ncbi:MAG: DUF4031 domain-containing protein [Actinomycetota bacterium]
MAVLVDPAVWEWRGAQWAHLVSDESYDELHEFARRLGKRRLGFQGDHYDIETVDRERALALGAEAIDSRELVRRLRAAGLRRRDAKPTWQRIAFAPRGKALDVAARLVSFGESGLRLRAALQYTTGLDQVSQSGVYADGSFVAAIFDWVGPAATVDLPDLDLVWAGEPRADGERSLELFAAR